MMDDRIHFHADSSNKHNSENPERVVNARLKRKQSEVLTDEQTLSKLRHRDPCISRICGLSTLHKAGITSRPFLSGVDHIFYLKFHYAEIHGYINSLCWSPFHLLRVIFLKHGVQVTETRKIIQNQFLSPINLACKPFLRKPASANKGIDQLTTVVIMVYHYTVQVYIRHIKRHLDLPKLSNLKSVQ